MVRSGFLSTPDKNGSTNGDPKNGGYSDMLMNFVPNRRRSFENNGKPPSGLPTNRRRSFDNAGLSERSISTTGDSSEAHQNTRWENLLNTTGSIFKGLENEVQPKTSPPSRAGSVRLVPVSK